MEILESEPQKYIYIYFFFVFPPHYLVWLKLGVFFATSFFPLGLFLHPGLKVPANVGGIFDTDLLVRKSNGAKSERLTCFEK